MSSKRTRQRRIQSRLPKPEIPETQAVNREITEALKEIPRKAAMDSMINIPARTGVDHLINNNEYVVTRLTQNFPLMDRLYRGDWIAGRIINTIPEDMTKNWYEVTGGVEPEQKGKLRAVERKTHLQAKILEGLRWGRLYGGAAGIIVIKGQEDMLEEPLDLDTVTVGSFRGLIIADRWNGVYPSTELVEDLDDPDFGLPEYYIFAQSDTELDQGVRVHHSRVLRFEGRDLPYIERVSEQYWGMSEMEHVFEELNKRNAVSANIAQLIFIAHLRVLKIEDLGQALAMADEQSQRDLYATIQAQNMLMNNFSMQVLSQGDDFQTFQYSFSGLSDVYEQFMMDLSGAAEIPATKLFGRAPQGMNATGEGDLRNYYDTVKQAQERLLRPILEKLLPVLAMSTWGAIPDDMDIEFNPIRDTSDEERASLIQQSSGAIIQAFQAGLISQQIALKELRQSGAAYSMWTNISDEDIENADDTISQPDEMGGGMPGMGGPGGGPEGEMPPEEPQEGAEEAPPEEPEEEPTEEERTVMEMLAKQDKKQSQQTGDGGPGSGNFNHPGYKRGGGMAGLFRRQPMRQERQPEQQKPKKASLLQRARMLLRIYQGPNAQARRRDPASRATVEKNNRERKKWSQLTLRQKVQGANAQRKKMNSERRKAAGAALRGNLEEAKGIMKSHPHYFSNSESAGSRVQSETLAEQRKVKPLFGGRK